VLSVKILQTSLRGTINRLNRLALAYKKPRALYVQWGIKTKKWITDNFTAEGALLQEGKWAALSPITIKVRKAKSRRRIVILRDTGKLKSSFKTRMLSNNRGIVIGTRVKYGRYHEFGSPKKHLPKRRILPRKKDKTFMDRLNKATARYIRQIVRKAGG